MGHVFLFYDRSRIGRRRRRYRLREKINECLRWVVRPAIPTITENRHYHVFGTKE